jgi:hypothetical protein
MRLLIPIPPPMTLPQETQTKISTDAQASANIQDFNYPADVWNNTEVAEREHIAGYELGATEWAGKAKPVVDALQYLYDGYGEDWPADVKSIVSAALAKYKEVPK